MPALRWVSGSTGQPLALAADETFTSSLQVLAHDPLAEVSEREGQILGANRRGQVQPAIDLPESADQHRRMLADLASLGI